MKIGVMTFVTDDSMPIVELAVAAEARGFESLFVPEKTQRRAAHRSRSWPQCAQPPGPAGGSWLRRVRSLAAAAGELTERLSSQ